jgi:ribose/xylose/arabinose/galactoside ABC-type transport system permease subunit
MRAVATRVWQGTGRYGIALVLLLLVLFAGIVSPEFRTLENLRNVLNQSAALAVLSLGQTLVIAAGLIDLSVGQLLGLVTVLACDVMQGSTARILPAVGLALAVGCGVGVINGLLLNRLRLHPLILTFGMLSVLQGIIFTYTDRSIGQAAPEIIALANGAVAGIPASLFVVALLAAGAHHLLNRTRFGLHLRAVGDNAEYARRAGVDLDRTRLLVFALSGASAALGGILLAGRLGTGYPNAGSGFELDAIVAVVLGGTSLAGGRGTVLGTLLAVLVLGVASNLLNLLEVPAFIQMAIKGGIVILAVLVYQPRQQAPA